MLTHKYLHLETKCSANTETNISTMLWVKPPLS